jgi:hypothetical protein
VGRRLGTTDRLFSYGVQHRVQRRAVKFSAVAWVVPLERDLNRSTYIEQSLGRQQNLAARHLRSTPAGAAIGPGLWKAGPATGWMFNERVAATRTVLPAYDGELLAPQRVDGQRDGHCLRGW